MIILLEMEPYLFHQYHDYYLAHVLPYDWALIRRLPSIVVFSLLKSSFLFKNEDYDALDLLCERLIQQSRSTRWLHFQILEIETIEYIYKESIL